MLNLKKGLALVLAAATALTFAPVANLGASVQAEAAEGDKTAFVYNAGTSKFENSSAPSDSNDIGIANLDAGRYVLETTAENANGLNVKLTDQASNDLNLDINLKRNGSHAFYVAKKGAYTVTLKETIPTKNGTTTFRIRKISNDGVNNVTTMSAASVGTHNDDTIGAVYEFTVTVKGVNAPKIKDSYTLWDKTAANNGAFHDGYTTDIYNVDTYYVGYHKSVALKTLANQLDANSSNWETTPTTPLPGTVGEDYKWVVSGTDYVSASENVASGAQSLGDRATDFKIYGEIAGHTTVTVKAVALKDVYKGQTKLVSKGGEIASKTFNVNVIAQRNLRSVTWKDADNGKTAYLYGFQPDGYTETEIENVLEEKTQLNLGTQIKKSAKLNVEASGSLLFTSSDPSVATVAQDGTVTVVSKGTTNITINAAAAGSIAADSTVVPVVVSDTERDIIDLTINGAYVNSSEYQMDTQSQAAAGAVKTAQVVAASHGKLPVTFTSSDPTVATISSTGLITATNKTGTTTITAETKDAGNIFGKVATFTVRVNALPAAVINVEEPTLDLSTKISVALAPTVTGNDKAVFSYKQAKINDDITDLKGNVVTAKRLGVSKVVITTPATTAYRTTSKTISVTVVADSTKAASPLAVTSSKSLSLKAGETSQIAATASGAAISYKSDDEAVATVSNTGLVTAVKAGVAVITVTTPADATHNAGTEYIKVEVKDDSADVDVTTPAKVTGVKVSNKKGGYVTVTWTQQDQKNVKYYIKKTVGKKSSGKSVNGGKTTLTVKKGATVKVKVKAYVYDKTGKKLVGSYSKTVTKKTDKK
jgi:uncharacterized protein YjdB